MGRTYAHAVRTRRRIMLVVMGLCGGAAIIAVSIATNLALGAAMAVWTGSCWYAGGQYGYLVGRHDAFVVAVRNRHRRAHNGP